MEASEVAGAEFWQTPQARVLAPPALEEEGRELAAHLGGQSVLVFASSGSSGPPKWVALERGGLLASARAVNAHLQVEPGDAWVLALPLFHVGGFGVAARAFAAGCGFHHFRERWDPSRFADFLDSHRGTHLSLVPAQVHDLVRAGLRGPASLRAVVVGGGRLEEPLGCQARALGWPVLQSYGMTEAASQVATADLDSLRVPFRNAPLPVLSLWNCRVAEDGCLALKGESLLKCYLSIHDGELVEHAAIDREGWFHTSDRVALAPEGLTVLGRADRQVKILGELVDLGAIEDALGASLPAGLPFTLLALADERRGWRLVPVLETGESTGAVQAGEECIRRLNENLPGYSKLEAPVPVTELPRGALGKIDRTALERQVRERFR